MDNHNNSTEPLTPSKKPVTSLVLGIVGMVAWCIPLAGVPVTIVGIVFGAKGLSSTSDRGMAIAGLTLSIIGLVLSVINAIYGAYLGATGQLF